MLPDSSRSFKPASQTLFTKLIQPDPREIFSKCWMEAYLPPPKLIKQNQNVIEIIETH